MIKLDFHNKIEAILKLYIKKKPQTNLN